MNLSHRSVDKKGREVLGILVRSLCSVTRDDVCAFCCFLNVRVHACVSTFDKPVAKRHTHTSKLCPLFLTNQRMKSKLVHALCKYANGRGHFLCWIYNNNNNNKKEGEITVQIFLEEKWAIAIISLLNSVEQCSNKTSFLCPLWTVLFIGAPATWLLFC